LARREKRGRRPGTARFAAAPGRPGGGVRKKKGRGGERLTGGAHMSARRNKKKKERGGAGWREEKVNGPLGRRAERRKGKFFSFLFQTFFKSNFSFQIQTKNSSNLFTKFYKLLNFTQATKSYAKSKK
jgi:hypothetical protein